MKRGMFFETANGNVYYYNDIDGSIYPLECIDSKFCGVKLVDRDSSREQDLSEHNIRLFLNREGYKQLILIVTEDCNLRCRYCAYSGAYKNMRTHRSVSMDLDTASEALLRYFDGFKLTKQINPYRIPVIGFYGGEPLLNFKLIAQVTQLAKKLYSKKIRFTVTTNGTIITPQMLDFFVSHDFFLSISLNGPQGEHDRLRTFEDGRGSFRLVWQTLELIRNKYPDYYKSNYNLLVCYDPGSDLESMLAFFTEHEAQLPPIARVSPVSPHFTNWYKRYTLSQKAHFANLLHSYEEAFFATLKKGGKASPFLDRLFGSSYRMILLQLRTLKQRKDFLPYTSACLPGEKIAVDPYGNFHCCEKMNYQFPIGNANIGLDIDMIVGLLTAYQEAIFPECRHCPITRLCPVCYSTVAGNGWFKRDPPALCTNYIADIRTKLSKLWTLFEDGVPESVLWGAGREVPCSEL